MILITGASKGIGKFLLKKFVNKNEKVFGTYNTTIPEDELIHYFMKVDITKIYEIKNWFEKIENLDTKIVLINCAGINYNAFAHKSDIEKWREVIEVNLIATFNVILSVLPKMREQNYGRIINLSSVVPKLGVPGTSAYSAAKAGLWGLTRAIAVENARKNITVNNINLGYFEIGMIEQVPIDMQDVIKSKIPFLKFGNPEDIFKTILFLIDTDYITGTSVDINGGIL